MIYANIVTLKFHYNNSDKINTCSVLAKDLEYIIKRIAEKKGILNISGEKIDLTMLKKIDITFERDYII